MNILAPVFQDYEYSTTPTQQIVGAGLPISKIIVSESTRDGGSQEFEKSKSADTVAQRISDLTVPYGLVLLDDTPRQTISYQYKPVHSESLHSEKSSKKALYSSSVIPDTLYANLIHLVEYAPSSRKRDSRKTKDKSSGKSSSKTKRRNFLDFEGSDR